MSLIVVEAPIGCLGFDTWSPFSGAQYAALKSLGFRFATRYLENTTPTEMGECLATGLMVNFVQAAHGNGWYPTPDMGRTDGDRALMRALALAVPPTLDLWCDVEGVSQTCSLEDLNGYAREWCRMVVSAGYSAKVYVGAGLPPKSDGQSLYALAFTGYWESQSDVPRVSARGYQMHQLFKFPTGQHQVKDIFPDAPASVANLLIDGDYTGCDFKGGRPRMLKAA